MSPSSPRGRELPLEPHIHPLTLQHRLRMVCSSQAGSTFSSHTGQNNLIPHFFGSTASFLAPCEDSAHLFLSCSSLLLFSFILLLQLRSLTLGSWPALPPGHLWIAAAQLQSFLNLDEARPFLCLTVCFQ